MIESMKRLFRMAGEYKRKMILSVLLAIGSVAAGIVPYFFIGWFVAQIIGGGLLDCRLFIVAAAVGACLILKSVMFLLSTRLSHQAAYRILRNLRLQLAEKLTRLPLGYVLERDSGVIKKIMENDVEELERFLAHNIPETISSAVVPVAVIGYLAFLDWRMVLIMLICIALAMLFYAIMMRGNNEKMQRYYSAVDNMNAVVVEYVNGMKEIKAFNQSEHSFSRFRNAVQKYRRYVLDWYKACWPLMSAYNVLIQASLVTVLPGGLFLLWEGTLSFPVFILFLLISMGFAPPLIKLAEFADSIKLVVHAEQNIHNILSERELPVKRGKAEPKNCDLVFEKVTFSYDGKTDILKKMSFAAPEGRSMAIVGESGSGKSTIAKLVCRFWDVGGGSIRIGGVDIRDMEPDRLMSMVSFVFQDTFLFNISIGDNIRVGRPGATDREVVEAARLARCHDFILQTKQGYDTLAGDAGNRLSGGERQRICIARAVLKNAPILILDEATASIDPDQEEQIQEAVGALARGKTLIVIAHRIRTIMNFDNMLLIRDGSVCAQGSHAELLKSSPEYQSMFRSYAETENWVMEVGKEGSGC
jgi:ATP-binding cassette subfamily B protein